MTLRTCPKTDWPPGTDLAPTAKFDQPRRPVTFGWRSLVRIRTRNWTIGIDPVGAPAWSDAKRHTMAPSPTSLFRTSGIDAAKARPKRRISESVEQHRMTDRPAKRIADLSGNTKPSRSRRSELSYAELPFPVAIAVNPPARRPGVSHTTGKASALLPNCH